MKYNFNDEFVKSNRKSFDTKKKNNNLNEDFDNIIKKERKKKVAFKNYLHRLDTDLEEDEFY